MAEIKIMVDFEGEGIWCNDEIYQRIPADLHEKFRAWNWWWELGQYRLCARGVFSECNPDFDHEECAWIGLGLAMQLQMAMPDDRVIFVHEAELDRAIDSALAAGHHDVSLQQYIYEIFVSLDRIEARHVLEE